MLTCISVEINSYYLCNIKGKDSRDYRSPITDTMEEPIKSNRRIARNAIYLYGRMAVTLAVSLYTSRVVLNMLGVTDFGIYNIVGSIVVLSTALNHSVVNAIQRYLAYYLGKGDEGKLQPVFSNSLILTGFLFIIILLLTETLGLWYINSELKIPADKVPTANIVYQISILTTLVSLLRSPYQMAVTAYERMNFLALSSIAESIIKLVLVLCLAFSDSDRLVMYALLMLLLTAIVTVIYITYCRHSFKYTRFSLRGDKKLLKEMGSFSGWSVCTSISDMGYQQGIGLVLNYFCGVAYNATLGITNQIKGAVFSFCANLQTAFNPQIVKTYAAGDTEYCSGLTGRACKFSYYLMLLICLPVMLNIDMILKAWLVSPPPECSIFVNLMLSFCLVDSLVGPLWTAAQASGRIKVYNIVSSILLLMNLPASWIALKAGMPAWSIIAVQIIFDALTLGYRIGFVARIRLFTVAGFLRKVLRPVAMVSAICTAVCLLIHKSYIPDSWPYLLGSTLLILPTTALMIYLLGLDSQEKGFVKSLIHKFTSRHHS